MMKRQYLIAIVIGFVIGLYALVSAAMSPGLFEFSLTRMKIPFWDEQLVFNAKPFIAVALQYQAVLLRFCSLTLEHGFTFISVPIVLSCGYVQLRELGRKRFFPRLLTRTVKAAGFVLAGTYLLLMIPIGTGMLASISMEMLLPSLFLSFPALLVMGLKICFVQIVLVMTFFVQWWLVSIEWEHEKQELTKLEK